MLIFCGDNSCGDVVKDGDGAMNDKLKPCPFCGNEPTLIVYRGKDGWRDRYAVLCRYDDGGCGAESGWYHYEEETIEAWNRRANCPECIKED